MHEGHSETSGLHPKDLKARELLVTCRKMASLAGWRMNGYRENLGSRRETAVPVHTVHARWCEQKRTNINRCI